MNRLISHEDNFNLIPCKATFIFKSFSQNAGFVIAKDYVFH